jgi:ankyrin repeat protein
LQQRIVMSELVRILLTDGADVNLKAENGRSPLHNAAETGNAEVVKMLLDA